MRTIKARASVYEAALEEVKSIATELYLSHTVNGEWKESEEAAKEQHDYLTELAKRMEEDMAA